MSAAHVARASVVRRPKSLSLFAQRYGWSYVFIAPTLLFFALFTLLPVIQAFLLSLQNATIVGGTWVGIDNFLTLARDPIFLKAVANTVVYSIITVAAQIGLALLIAGLLQPLSKNAQSFYRALFYLPLVNSAILVAMVWRWIFNPNPFGLANALLSLFGLNPHPWIGSSDEALAAVILSTVLIIPGGGVVLYSAAIGGIPRELYEAADVEGAGWYTKWRHITIPLLRPTTLYLIVVYTIAAFQVFERVYIMTNGGGPNNATITIVQLIYSTAFQFGRYGLASAQAVVLFVMAVVVAVIQFRWLQSDVEY